MRNLILTMVMTVLSVAAHAEANLSAYQKNIQQVTSLEAAGRIKEALNVSMQTSMEISAAIGVQQTVASVGTTLNEIRQEVVTERHSVGGGFSLLGLISGQANSSWDVARILVANPQEVAGFDTKIANDFRNLQGQLSNYLKANELSLIYIKAFATKALQLAGRLSFEDRQNVRDSLAQTVQMAQAMSFDGVHSIERCLTINYANRTSSSSAGIGGIFFSLRVNSESAQVAHQEKSCSKSAAGLQVSESVIRSAKLALADELMASYDQALGVKDAVQGSAPSYPTWGLPSYR